METLKLVRLDWISEERDKYIWEDMYAHPWDEIIGRIYLLRAHSDLEETYYGRRHKADYKEALDSFKHALALFAKDGNQKEKEYYYRALADKALVQCYLGQYTRVLADVDEALAGLDAFYQDTLKANRASILVLTGAFEEGLTLLEHELQTHPDDTDLQFTRATCLLHLKRYDEARSIYEQLKEQHSLPNERGLLATRQRQQPDWDEL